MGGQPRDRDRDGGAGPGDLHGDERFPPRLRSLRREAQASIQRRLMADRSFLDWPFFDEGHRRLAEHLEGWCKAELRDGHDEEDVDRTCRDLVRRLGTGGWLRYAVPKAYGGVHDSLDVRSLALIRETLARHSGLADFAFAMQGRSEENTSELQSLMSNSYAVFCL